MARLTAVVLIVAALVALPACGDDSEDAAADPPAWNHDPGDASGPTGWGSIDESYEQCVSGSEQSPVDIATTVETLLPRLEFNYPPTPLVVENTGHVIEVPMPEESENTLLIGDGAYRLAQYHFHAPSEHTLDGKSFEAEAHLVHESDDGQLAVVGVFLDEGLSERARRCRSSRMPRTRQAKRWRSTEGQSRCELLPRVDPARSSTTTSRTGAH